VAEAVGCEKSARGFYAAAVSQTDTNTNVNPTKTANPQWYS